MKPGDLIRVTWSDLIYTTRRGVADCIGAADKGEILLVLDKNETSKSVKILHPAHGIGFITRGFTEVINETR